MKNKIEAILIDHMGSDLTVVNAARVSFAKESNWMTIPEGGRIHNLLEDSDEKLITYLADHNHWTPFGHCMVTLREKVPIFVARQRFKHTIGFCYNEISRRYVDDEPEFFIPDKWRKAADNKKQGSSDEEIDINPYNLGGSINPYVYLLIQARLTHKKLLDMGICPEQARMVLPQSMITEYYVTGSLAAWVRAYKLRIDNHAQKEIQNLAEEWNKIIKPLFPVSWKALTD